VTPNIVMAIRSVAKLFAGDIIEEARRVQAEWIYNTGEEQVPAGIPTPPATLNPDGTEQPREELVGPLRPDHLREALLRYQRENRSGGVGMQNLWHVQQQSGVEQFSTRNRRRIFR
jgi:transcription initiation factor TFIID subunit 11